ncbi:CpaD family pilus assembly protein [Sphingomonas sp.]|uniref:CpaD family pilus assembly protein n=1 Tax=Sphingomonas sp. TaxID=28214 RepID=UPI0025DE0997|nr:CpaD family pilus assembly protein [Sphingomonas sp.]
MRKLPVLALIACGISLSACATDATSGLESVHQPVVSRTDYVFDVSAPGSDQLAMRDADRLDGWFQSIKLRFGDRISVDALDGDRYARQAVANVTARYGLLVEERAPVTEGSIPPGAIRVIVSRMTASVPHCPDFGRLSQPQFTGKQASNYGCAINSNLAAMVADPHDLLAGRDGEQTVDAWTSTKAIKAYRLAPTTGTAGLTKESTKNGGGN